MTTIALVESASGWEPRHVSQVKQGETFYLVKDGKTSPISVAMSNAVPNKTCECGWEIPAKEVTT